MRRFFAAIFVVIIMSSSRVFAAGEDAQYSKLHGEIVGLRVDVRAVAERIDSLSRQVVRVSDSTFRDNVFFAFFVILGMSFVIPIFVTWRDRREEKKSQARDSSFTLEDVKRLITEIVDENNAKLEEKFQTLRGA